LLPDPNQTRTHRHNHQQPRLTTTRGSIFKRRKGVKIHTTLTMIPAPQPCSTRTSAGKTATAANAAGAADTANDKCTEPVLITDRFGALPYINTPPHTHIFGLNPGLRDGPNAQIFTKLGTNWDSPWNTERNGFHTGRNVRRKGRLHSHLEGYAHRLLM